MSDDSARYLVPYLHAARRHGEGFKSLLWASPRTQKARFEAIRGAYDSTGKSVLDVGCGRADYLAYLIERGSCPADYVGIEMVEPLAAAAERRVRKARAGLRACILRADFVREPARLFVGADVVVFSGSLNTLDVTEFYDAIRRAYDAAAEAVVFNFLASPYLAGREYLTWHEPGDVLHFARALAGNVLKFDDYLRGDCTICITK